MSTTMTAPLALAVFPESAIATVLPSSKLARSALATLPLTPSATVKTLPLLRTSRLGPGIVTGRRSCLRF